MRIISIRKISIPEGVLKLISPATAYRFNIIPLSFVDELLVIAVSPDADAIDIMDSIESETGYTVECVQVDNHDDLAVALKRYYPASTLTSSKTVNDLFHLILNRSLQLRASDIHICPLEEGGEIQLRIDGAMRVDRTIETNTLIELTAIIKIAANLDIAEKRTPLDGNINFTLHGEEISLRVATIPTIYGEHITLRLLTQDHGEELEQIESLGLAPIHKEVLLAALAEPNGIILLSGPTGSGKTTTLYAALRHLRKREALHLVSIEDPVEKPVDGVTQIKIDSDSERLTFNKALRSVLRHDPDVIMVGEIRDGETADIAVKSALTGHLVLSTLHTNSASGVLTRLINIGIAPFMVASTLRLAIAQRLVRVPCQHCVKMRRPTEDECQEFGWDCNDEQILVPEPEGCDFCGGKGYAGRIGLYEMILVDDELRKMITKGADERDFEHYSFVEKSLPSLLQDGANKILAGRTTIQEVRNVTNTRF